MKHNYQRVALIKVSWMIRLIIINIRSPLLPWLDWWGDGVYRALLPDLCDNLNMTQQISMQYVSKLHESYHFVTFCHISQRHRGSATCIVTSQHALCACLGIGTYHNMPFNAWNCCWQIQIRLNYEWWWCIASCESQQQHAHEQQKINHCKVWACGSRIENERTRKYTIEKLIVLLLLSNITMVDAYQSIRAHFLCVIGGKALALQLIANTAFFSHTLHQHSDMYCN